MKKDVETSSKKMTKFLTEEVVNTSSSDEIDFNFKYDASNRTSTPIAEDSRRSEDPAGCEEQKLRKTDTNNRSTVSPTTKYMVGAGQGNGRSIKYCKQKYKKNVKLRGARGSRQMMRYKQRKGKRLRPDVVEVTVDIPEEDQEETVQEVAKSTVSPATKYMVRAEPGNERSSSESETESNIDVEGQPMHEKEERDEEQHEGPKITDEREHQLPDDPDGSDQEVEISTVSPATKYMVWAEPGNNRSSPSVETEINITVEESTESNDDTDDFESLESLEKSKKSSTEKSVTSVLVVPRDKSSKIAIWYYQRRANLRRRKNKYSEARSNCQRKLFNERKSTARWWDRSDSAEKRSNESRILNSENTQPVTRNSKLKFSAISEKVSKRAKMATELGQISDEDKKKVQEIEMFLEEEEKIDTDAEGLKKENDEKVEDVGIEEKGGVGEGEDKNGGGEGEGKIEPEKEKPKKAHQCRHCDFGATQKQKLNKHLAQVHGIQVKAGRPSKTPTPPVPVVNLSSSTESTPASSPLLSASRKRKGPEDGGEDDNESKKLKMKLQELIADAGSSQPEKEEKIGKEKVKTGTQLNAWAERVRDMEKEIGTSKQEVEEFRSAAMAAEIMRQEEERKRKALEKEVEEWKKISVQLGEKVEAGKAAAVGGDLEKIRKQLEEEKAETIKWKTIGMSQFASMNTLIKTNIELQQRAEFTKGRQVCRDWLKGNCRRTNCKFAHSSNPGVTNAAQVMNTQLEGGATGGGTGAQASAQGGGQARGGGQSVRDQDCHHWARGNCRYGVDCFRKHDPALNGSKRTRSNSHGTLQSFQQGAGMNNFTPGALAPLKEMGESKEMPEIPQVLMSKEVMKNQIDQLEKASANWGFGEAMVKAQLESLMRAPMWESNMELAGKLLASISKKSDA